MYDKEEFLINKNLVVEKSIEETFYKLKDLKLEGKKNTSDIIICNGYKLPAGAYEEFKLFIYCLNTINNYYNSDTEIVIRYLKEIIIESTEGIGHNEKIIAITGWNNFYKTLREDNKKLFTDREILALINELLNDKNEHEKHPFLIK